MLARKLPFVGHRIRPAVLEPISKLNQFERSRRHQRVPESKYSLVTSEMKKGRRMGVTRDAVRRVLAPALTALVTASAFADSGGPLGSMSRLFQSKESYTGPVATKVSEITESWDVWSLAFSPDSKELAAASPNSEEVHVWVWRGRGQVRRTLHLSGGSNVDGLRYSPDGRQLAGVHYVAEGNKEIRIWDTVSGVIAKDLGDPSNSSGYLGVAFSPDSHQFFRTHQREENPGDNLVVHSTSSWQPLWGLRTAPIEPDTLALSSDGSFAAIGGSTVGPGTHVHPKVLIVDLVQRAVVRTIDVLADDCQIKFLSWNGDGTRLAVGGRAVLSGSRLVGAAVEVLDTVKVTQIDEFTRPSASHVQALAYTPDGNYLIVGWDDVVQIWDNQHAALLQEIPEDAGAVTISRDGRYMGIGANKNVSVWEMRFPNDPSGNGKPK